MKHWPSERQSQIAKSDFTHCIPMDFALALPSSEAALKKLYRAAPNTFVPLRQGLSWLLCALRKQTSFPLPSPTAKHYISPPTPITASDLDGRATSSCPQMAALGREGSSPRWISAAPWVFYGLLLIYSQFSILVNGYKLDWSHKS